MALISKTNRCAVCGSSEVTYRGGLYHCAACGAEQQELMPAADVAAINYIIALGDEGDRLGELRRRYPRLDVTSWSRENRLQV